MSRETLPPDTVLRLSPTGLRFPLGYAWGFVDVDPPMAAALLERAPFQPVEDAFSKAYADWMAVDGWRLTADSIALDREGGLQDGVARLLGCVASGRPFRTLAVTGLEPGVRPALDLRTPNRRPPLPEVEWGGGAFALVARALGGVPFALALSSPGARTVAAQGILASVASAEGIPTGGGLSADALAAIHYLASAEDPDRANAFLDAMALPQLEPGSAPQVLAASLDALDGFDEEHALRALAVAWRAYMRGKPFDGTEARAPDGAGVLADLATLRLRSLPGPVPAVRGPDPSVAFETVDPRKAASWLAPLGASRGGGDACPAFVEDLVDLRWARTGHTLKLGPGDALVDGTRRLRAVLASNRPIKGLVARGVEASCVDFLDHGRRGRLSMRDANLERQEADEAMAGMRAIQRGMASPPPPDGPVGRARKQAIGESVAAARRGRGTSRAWKADLPSLFDVSNPSVPHIGRGQR